MELQRVLDDLNAFGFLDDARRKVTDEILCFGPKDVYGSSWSGVVIWFRPTGYHGYKALTLLGIWACADMDTVPVIMGTRVLAFSAPFYNPEAYFHHIRHSFDLYYSDDASPPTEPDRLYGTAYIPSRRLEIRGEIETVLTQYWPDH
jgi:hypothetical protein